MAMTVAVLSDTHGVLRPQVQEFLKKCDCIVHAGDFDDEDTLDWISEFAPLYAVRGNNDWNFARRLPQTAQFTLEGMNFFMVHDIASLPNPQPDADVIVFGHSHRYYCGQKNGVLWLNPGSCGRSRLGGELSMMMLHLDAGSCSVVRLDIPGANN